MFVILAVFIVLSSLATVLTKSIVRAATYLLFVLLGTAGLYFLMGYTFLGAVQVMVYAGGIIVLYVFSILLTSGRQEQLSRNTVGKVLASAGFAPLPGIWLGAAALAIVIACIVIGKRKRKEAISA